MARVGLVCVLLSVAVVLPLAAQDQSGPLVTLPGHVLGVLPKAAKQAQNLAQPSQQSLTLTVVLNLSDRAGFASFAADFENPDSPNYHHTLRVGEFAERFGPSQEAYDRVLAYLQQNGFSVVAGSANRRTITVRGTRVQAENAFHVTIGDYQLGNRNFHAIETDPAVPADLAPVIGAVVGLSSLAQHHPSLAPSPATPMSTAIAYHGALTPAGSTNGGHALPPGLDGTGQTVALIEFDNFDYGDVADWLFAVGLPPTLINQVTTSNALGGTSPSNGLGTKEVLLDIAGVLGIAQGAKLIVYPASFQDVDFLTAVNFTISDLTNLPGATILQTWLDCESEISSSDAVSMDGLLKEARFYGFTLFTSTGDTGSTCTSGDGTKHPNMISYPSDTPHAIAVGGTTLSVNSNNTYQSESWWLDGGGYGFSQYFGVPGHQSFLAGATGRSVPDVSIQAEPGITVCMATPENFPGCSEIGGTSMSAPFWAGIWAIASQAQMDANGFVFSPANGYFYTIPHAFHTATSMTGTGNDFYHVGLGSPNITTLIAKAVAPQSSSFSPDSGPGAGGTKVTIHGGGFIGVERVTFGGVKGAHLTVYSDGKLTIKSPPAKGDTVEIEVVTPGGVAKVGKFHYIPEITGVSPSSGPLEGGTTVSVTGRALNASYTFKFGGALATHVSCASASKCTMDTPYHAPGTVAVIAEAPVGNSPAADLFTYLRPSITGFSPAVAPTIGGLLVTITGVSFKSGMTVDFGGGAEATGVSCSDTTFCGLTTPANAAGTVHPTVTVDGFTSAPFAGKFVFKVFPTITSISPNIIPPNTGSVTVEVPLTITGTGFSTTPGSTVFNLAGTTLGSVVCTSSTTCTAGIFVPAHVTSSTTSPVTVTVGGLTSLDSVNLTYPAALPPPPPCKGTKCF